MKQIEITITADLPDEETGHEAVVGTKAATEEVKRVLEDMKLKNIHSHRRIVSRKDKTATAAPKAGA
jgi:hypothetical protein